MTELIAQPLTATAFSTFGEVIDLQGGLDYAQRMVINDGLTERFHDLFTIDISAQGAGGAARPIVSLFQTKPLPLPHRVRVMERHPLSSQAFLPLDDLPFLVLVATATDGVPMTATALSLFITNGRQGINFYRNTWHHFQIVLGKTRRFMVVDRAGSGENLQQTELQDEVWIPAAEY